jgi:hypothetical protein
MSQSTALATGEGPTEPVERPASLGLHELHKLTGMQLLPELHQQSLLWKEKESSTHAAGPPLQIHLHVLWDSENHGLHVER